MVKRTKRRKNKSKRKNKSRRKYVGGGVSEANYEKIKDNIRRRSVCLQFCSSCGQGNIGNKGLCKDSSGVYKCSCGFTLVNPIAERIIYRSYQEIKGQFDGNFKIKPDKMTELKQFYRTEMSKFNIACECKNKTWTEQEIALLTTTNSGVEHNRILDNIREAALQIGMDMGVGSVRSLTKPMALLKWLPLKETDFYQSIASKAFSSITGSITNSIKSITT